MQIFKLPQIDAAYEDPVSLNRTTRELIWLVKVGQHVSDI
jgi:hypothetical protein